MRSLFLLIVALSCLTGCKTRIPLTYQPIQQKCASNNIPVSVASFQDSRKNPAIVGSKRNGYGISIIKIITQDSATDWVTNALKAEMSNAGYAITESSSDATYEVSGTLLNVYTTTYFIYHGRMSILVSVQKNGEKVFEKTYNTKKSGGFNWFATNKSCSKTLEINLQEVCAQFIKDFRVLNENTLSPD